MRKKTDGQNKTSPFRYGFGMFGTSLPVNMFKSFAAIYYVDMLGLAMTKYSLVLFIYTFIDAIDNPIYGFLSDRTNTKWGKRRPWLVIGAPLLCLCFILFYNVPNAVVDNQTMLFVYMLLMYILRTRWSTQTTAHSSRSSSEPIKNAPKQTVYVRSVSSLQWQ